MVKTTDKCRILSTCQRCNNDCVIVLPLSPRVVSWRKSQYSPDMVTALRHYHTSNDNTGDLKQAITDSWRHLVTAPDGTDYCGWVTDATTDVDMWCVVRDMLMVLYDSQACEKVKDVYVLPLVIIRRGLSPVDFGDTVDTLCCCGLDTGADSTDSKTMIVTFNKTSPSISQFQSSLTFNSLAQYKQFWTVVNLARKLSLDDIIISENTAKSCHGNTNTAIPQFVTNASQSLTVEEKQNSGEAAADKAHVKQEKFSFIRGQKVGGAQSLRNSADVQRSSSYRPMTCTSELTSSAGVHLTASSSSSSPAAATRDIQRTASTDDLRGKFSMKKMEDLSRKYRKGHSDADGCQGSDGDSDARETDTQQQLVAGSCRAGKQSRVEKLKEIYSQNTRPGAAAGNNGFKTTNPSRVTNKNSLKSSSLTDLGAKPSSSVITRTTQFVNGEKEGKELLAKGAERVENAGQQFENQGQRGSQLEEFLYYRGNLGWTKLWCVLSDDELVAYRDASRDYVVLKLNLNDCSITAHDPKAHNSFVIQSDLDTHTFSCRNAASRQLWSEALRSVSNITTTFDWNSLKRSHCSTAAVGGRFAADEDGEGDKGDDGEASGTRTLAAAAVPTFQITTAGEFGVLQGTSNTAHREAYASNSSLTELCMTLASSSDSEDTSGMSSSYDGQLRPLNIRTASSMGSTPQLSPTSKSLSDIEANVRHFQSSAASGAHSADVTFSVALDDGGGELSSGSRSNVRKGGALDKLKSKAPALPDKPTILPVSNNRTTADEAAFSNDKIDSGFAGNTDNTDTKEQQQQQDVDVREKQELLLQMLGDLRNDVVRRMSQRLLRAASYSYGSAPPGDSMYSTHGGSTTSLSSSESLNIKSRTQLLQKRMSARLKLDGLEKMQHQDAGQGHGQGRERSKAWRLIKRYIPNKRRKSSTSLPVSERRHSHVQQEMDALQQELDAVDAALRCSDAGLAYSSRSPSISSLAGGVSTRSWSNMSDMGGGDRRSSSNYLSVESARSLSLKDLSKLSEPMAVKESCRL